MTKSWPILVILAGALVAPSVGRAAPKKEEDPVPWQVKPDPMPFRMEGPFGAERQIPLVGFNAVQFPNSPSPYFGIVVPADKKEGPQLKMYDLRTMGQVGQTVKHDKDLPN